MKPNELVSLLTGRARAEHLKIRQQGWKPASQLRTRVPASLGPAPIQLPSSPAHPLHAFQDEATICLFLNYLHSYRSDYKIWSALGADQNICIRGISKNQGILSTNI